MDNTTETNGLIMDVIGWFAHPFKRTGDPQNWLLALGFLIVVWWFWNHVLITIAE